MAMIGAAGNESLTDRIYEAAVLPELWRPVLQQFASVAESLEAIVVATDGVDFRWATSSDRFAELTQQHYSYPASRERARRLLSRRHAGFLGDIDVFDETELESEPLFTEFLIPNGFGRGIATGIEVPGGDTIIFHAEGPFSMAPFSPDLVGRLDALRPHLARSALISARLGFERARTAVETLAGIGFAACAVRSSGSVILANQQFEGEAAIWTTRGGDKVALLDGRADTLLTDAFSRIGLEAGVRSIPLRGGPETSPAVLHVVPVRRAAHDLFGQATAILVLTKASATPTNQTPLLQALFDLSPTEAAVAARIAAGQSIDEIACADAKSAETVRNQLKSVLAKTGCRRQVDLARMLAQMVGP
jgi:DNA-binding CsgD family transcriptional regulator